MAAMRTPPKHGAKKHASAFEALQILQTNNWEPSLVLIDENEREDRVSVKHYKTDELYDYLQQKLIVE